MSAVYLLLAILAIAFLAVVGFFPNIWILVALVAVLILWQSLERLFPNKKNFVKGSLVVILSFCFVVNVLVSWIIPRFPMTLAALSRAGVNTDRFVASMTNPFMLKAEIAIENQMQWIQDVIGERYAKDFEGIRQRVREGKINEEQAWLETQAIIRKSQEISKSLLMRGETSTSGRVIWFGLALLVLATILSLVPRITIPGRKIFGGLGATLLVIGLFLWAFPEVKEIPGKINPPQFPESIPKPPPQKPKEPAKNQTMLRFPPNSRYTLNPGEKIDGSIEGAIPSVVRWIFIDLSNGQMYKHDWPPGMKSFSLHNGFRSSVSIFLEISGEQPIPNVRIVPPVAKSFPPPLLPETKPWLPEIKPWPFVPPSLTPAQQAEAKKPPDQNVTRLATEGLIGYNEEMRVKVFAQNPLSFIRWYCEDQSGQTFFSEDWPANTDFNKFPNKNPGKVLKIFVEVPKNSNAYLKFEKHRLPKEG